jgi:hypothetical protein
MPRTNFRRKSSLTLLALSLAVSTTTTSASPILLLGNVPPPAAKAADNTARPLSIPFGQGTHVIQDTFIGAGFLDGFYFQDFDDPTHGRVKCVLLSSFSDNAGLPTLDFCQADRSTPFAIQLRQ